MSRCYPYPPPGYEGARTYDEALIKSIKLQKEEEKARKQERKEKRREKKEKKKDKKDEKVEDKQKSHKRRHKDERCKEDTKGGDHHKEMKNDTEQLEKSSLTVELGHPVCSQNLSDSTDSTQNSNKRPKTSVPSDGRHNSESILRIRLPLQRHKDPEVLPHRMGQPSSDLRVTGPSVEGKCESVCRPVGDSRDQPCSSNMVVSEIGERKPLLSSQASKVVAERSGISAGIHVSDSSPLEMQFRIFDSWIPPPLLLDYPDYDDQDWLSKTKKHPKSGPQVSKICSDGWSSANSVPWPHACYLPEADIYALPFTVPF